MRSVTMLLFMFLALSAQGASANDELGCDPNGQCMDECVYFEDGVTFHNTGAEAVLRYEGKTYKLEMVSERVTKRMDPVAELPGHTTETLFKGNGLSVVLKQVVLENGCYYKDEHGKYAPVETDCGGKSEMTLVVSKSAGKSKTMKSAWEWGC